MQTQAQQTIVQAQIEIISQKIQSDGPISFADYMQCALYHPTWGYYNNATQKLGAQGDFVTAPEISPLFGAALARQLATILPQLGTPYVLEFGAGTGKLATDILQTLQSLDQLPMHYYIREPSRILAMRQKAYIQATLPDLYPRVVWLEKLPATFSGIMIANEVLDAMPVHRFCCKDQDILENRVGYHLSKGLHDIWVPAEGVLRDHVAGLALPATRVPYYSEISLSIPLWLEEVSRCLSKGLVFILDYGFPQAAYYHPERHMGTLMCYHKHRVCKDPYALPGLQDMTADVNFSALSNAALASHCQIAAYTTQAHFLLACDILDLLKSMPGDREKIWEQSCALRTLLLPAEMGERVKVMILQKGITDTLCDLGSYDLQYQL